MNRATLRARVAELEAQERWTKMAEEDIDAARNLFVAAGALESYDGGNSPSCLPDCARAIIAELVISRARVAELEAQAKGHADECAVGIKLRDSVAAELGVLLDERKALILECLSLRQHHDKVVVQLAAVLPMLVGLLHDEAITASPRNLATAIDRITTFLEGNK